MLAAFGTLVPLGSSAWRRSGGVARAKNEIESSTVDNRYYAVDRKIGLGRTHHEVGFLMTIRDTFTRGHHAHAVPTPNLLITCRVVI